MGLSVPIFLLLVYMYLYKIRFSFFNSLLHESIKNKILFLNFKMGSIFRRKKYFQRVYTNSDEKKSLTIPRFFQVEFFLIHFECIKYRILLNNSDPTSFQIIT